MPCVVAIRAIVARVTETRYIGRANLAKRLTALEGTPARAVYAGGSARIELDESVLTVTPPFGLEHEGEYDVVRAGPLLDALEAAPRVAVVLVRMGGYAVGVFEGERLVASKVGTRFVKGRHKKGGSPRIASAAAAASRSGNWSTLPPPRLRGCSSPGAAASTTSRSGVIAPR